MKYINDSTGLSSEDVTVHSRKNNVSKWNSVFIHFHFYTCSPACISWKPHVYLTKMF